MISQKLFRLDKFAITNQSENYNPQTYSRKYPVSIFLVVEISLYNRTPGSQSVLIIGWWIYNPGAWERGALCSIPKVMCDTLSSHRLNPSPSKLCPSPPIPLSDPLLKPPSASPPHPLSPAPATAWSPLNLACAPLTDTGP